LNLCEPASFPFRAVPVTDVRNRLGYLDPYMCFLFLEVRTYEEMKCRRHAWIFHGHELLIDLFLTLVI